MRDFLQIWSDGLISQRKHLHGGSGENEAFPNCVSLWIWACFHSYSCFRRGQNKIMHICFAALWVQITLKCLCFETEDRLPRFQSFLTWLLIVWLVFSGQMRAVQDVSNYAAEMWAAVGERDRHSGKNSLAVTPWIFSANIATNYFTQPNMVNKLRSKQTCTQPCQFS